MNLTGKVPCDNCDVQSEIERAEIYGMMVLVFAMESSHNARNRWGIGECPCMDGRKEKERRNKTLLITHHKVLFVDPCDAPGLNNVCVPNAICVYPLNR